MRGIARVPGQVAWVRACALLCAIGKLGCAFSAFSMLHTAVPSRTSTRGAHAPRVTAVRANQVDDRSSSDLDGTESERFLQQELGFTPTQLATVIGARPLLSGRSAKILKAKLQWLLGLGIDRADLNEIALRAPGSLDSTWEDREDLNSWFTELGLSRLEIAKLVVRYPDVLSLSKNTLESNLVFVKRIEAADIGIRQFLAEYRSQSNLEPRLAFLQKQASSENLLVLQSSDWSMSISKVEQERAPPRKRAVYRGSA
mmetsp:Transcript_86771/g.244598  ORF Transcript_86771/g.244598 Transcript_86771/m.244598 type:complete len:257 (+) Transcript_86771:135-905(+)